MKAKNKNKLVATFIIIVSVALDQIIKYFVDLYLKPVDSLMIIPRVLQLNYVENTGAMMGMLGGKTALMSVFAVISLIAVGFIIYSNVLTSKIDYYSVVFIAAGGIGNIIDRVVRGFVIDYIEVLFVDFYVFNFADCLITSAAFVIIFNQIYGIYKEYKQKKAKAQDD